MLKKITAGCDWRAIAIDHHMKDVYKRQDEIDAEAIDLSADPTKPSALLVLALILIPIATITIGSFAPYFTPDGSFMRGFLSFIGNTGISMFIITMI